MTAITIFPQISIKITFQKIDHSKPIINEENIKNAFISNPLIWYHVVILEVESYMLLVCSNSSLMLLKYEVLKRKDLNTF